MVQLDGFSDVVLSLGSEAVDLAVLGGKELTIHGTVATSQERFAGCPQGSTGSGAVEVWGIGRTATGLIGIWTSQTNTFDVGCGELQSVQMIQLRSQPGSSATLDAVTITADACAGGAL